MFRYGGTPAVARIGEQLFKNQKSVRVTIYLVGVAAQVTSFFVTITSPEYADAFSQTANVLTTLALGTALSNIESGGDHAA